MSAPQVSAHQRLWLFAVVVLVLAVGAAVWSGISLRQLSASAAAQDAEILAHADAMFAVVRQRTQDNLRAECRLLVEDPRLKTTLATEGMDEATVADILGDLAKQRGSGLLLVLSPEGRVFAQAGADELRGLDLSASSVVKKAQLSSESVIGSWVIGRKTIDLGIVAVRFDQSIIAYLVVGQAVDQALLKTVADAAGVAAAVIDSNGVTIASSNDTKFTVAFDAFAHDLGAFKHRIIDLNDDKYIASVSDLEPGSPSHPRLALLRPMAPSPKGFNTLAWLLGVPPLLVFVAVILATRRSSLRAS